LVKFSQNIATMTSVGIRVVSMYTRNRIHVHIRNQVIIKVKVR